MLDSDRPALSALLKPRSPNEFFAGFWPDKSTHFLVEGDPARLPEFLRSKELQSFEILARANRGGAWMSNAPKSSYMMPIDKRAAEFVYKMGLTIYLDDVTAAVPGARSFARQIEAELGLTPGSARATAWASPSENGAACHYDAHDIISIQLRGTKRFELAPVEGLVNPFGKQYSSGATRPEDETYPQMGNGFPSWQDATFESLEVVPGSVLVFRRGTWHRTHASADSLAVAFVLEPPSAADCILRQLRYVMLQDPRWRKPLYGAWGRGGQREAAFHEAAALLEQIPELARAIAPRDVALPFMPEEQRLASIDGGSRFQRIPDTNISPGAISAGAISAGAISAGAISPEPLPGEPVEVGIVRRHEDGSQETLATLTVPHRGLGVLDWIVAQDAPFRADDLAGRFSEIPFDGLRRLLESCAKGGLVRMLWFPAFRGGGVAG